MWDGCQGVSSCGGNLDRFDEKIGGDNWAMTTITTTIAVGSICNTRGHDPQSIDMHIHRLT